MMNNSGGERVGSMLNPPQGRGSATQKGGRMSRRSLSRRGGGSDVGSGGAALDGDGLAQPIQQACQMGHALT